jgi:hypothetical protein
MGIQLISVQDSRAYLASYHLTVIGKLELKSSLTGSSAKRFSIPRMRDSTLIRMIFAESGSSARRSRRNVSSDSR